MRNDVPRRPVDLAPPHGSSFFEAVVHLIQGSPDRRLRALHTQHRTEFQECGIRVNLHQFAETNTVDLDAARLWFRRPGRDFAVLATTLLDSTHPRCADAEEIGNLFRLHRTVARREHPITKILRVGNGHPGSFPAHSIEPAKKLCPTTAKRNPYKRLTRYTERQSALG